MVRPTIILMAFMTLSAVFDVQAAVLKGLVLANEWGGPPVAGVEIASTEGEGRAVSDAAGAFTLVFQDKHAGDTVTLSARREGYEVVNDIQLDYSLREEPESSPLVLLLCTQGNREEMTRRMVHLMAVKAIEENYGLRLKELEKQEQNALEGLPDLRRRLDQANAALATIPRALAKRREERVSGRYRQVIRLFLTGNIAGALGIFEKWEADRHKESAAQSVMTKLCRQFTLT